MQRLTQSTSCFQFSVSAKEMEKLSYSLHITAAESTNQNVVRISVFLVVVFFFFLTTLRLQVQRWKIHKVGFSVAQDSLWSFLPN